MIRKQGQGQTYPPAVYYELNPEKKGLLDSITAENKRTLTYVDKWVELRSLLRTIEDEEQDLFEKFTMFASLCETFLQNEMDFVLKQLTIAAIIRNQKRRDSQDIRKLAAANFASYSQLIFDLCSISSAFRLAYAFTAKDEGTQMVLKDYDYDLAYLIEDEDQESYEALMWEAYVPPTGLTDGSKLFRIPTIASVRQEAKRMRGRRFLRRYVKKIEKLQGLDGTS